MGRQGGLQRTGFVRPVYLSKGAPSSEAPSLSSNSDENTWDSHGLGSEGKGRDAGSVSAAFALSLVSQRSNWKRKEPNARSWMWALSLTGKFACALDGGRKYLVSHVTWARPWG